MSSSLCPERRLLDELIAGNLAPDRLSELEVHLDGCPSCRQVVDAGFRRDPVRPAGTAVAWDPPSVELRRAMAELQGFAPTRAAGDLPNGPVTERFGRLGEYELRREIGRGGMGQVYEAFDPALERIVAIKVIAGSGRDPVARERFLREARAAAALEHDHIVPIHAVGQAGDDPFLVMQFVAGESLADRLGRIGRLPVAEVARIGAHVARGLAAAHAKGFIHRDIKPANILLESATGRAKVVDFGLAKLVGAGSVTAVGTIVGTPEFMSPEQAAGGIGTTVDARSDLFSLGVVLYAACAGASPFRADCAFLTLDRIRREQPKPLREIDSTIPNWFSAIVDRLLEKEADDRIGSAEQLARLLENADGPTRVGLESIERPKRRRSGRWPAAIAIGLLAAGLFVLAIVRPFGLTNESIVPKSPPPGISIVGQDRTFADLAEAVAASTDQDTIDVNGPGPFPSSPIRIVGKRLTIRAVAPTLPIFEPDARLGRPKQPLLSSDSDLQLEGIEIHWDVDGPLGWTEAEQFGRAAIASTGGRLVARNCRIVAGRAGIAIASRGDLRVEHSAFVVGDLGFCAHWRPTGGSFHAEHCQFEGRVAVSVSTVAEMLAAPAAVIRLDRNTIATEKAINLQIDLGPRQPLRIESRGNLFNAPQLVVLFALRPIGKLDSPKPDDRGVFLRSFVEWVDESNLYRRGSSFLAASAVKQAGKTVPAGIDELSDWLQLWKLTATRSIQGTPRFADRAATNAALRLLAVDDATGELPEAGANVERLGPGSGE